MTPPWTGPTSTQWSSGARWDGIDRLSEYLKWVRHVDEATLLLNRGEAIVWNLDKTYLRQLEHRGVPTIPTQWVAPGEPWTHPDGLFIVKPSVGAGARNTAVYSASAVDDAQSHVSSLGELGQTTLVQRYFPSVDEQGETSIIFIAGEPSHAIRKGAFLKANEGAVERLWERATNPEPCQPTPRQLDVASQACRIIETLVPGPIVYARVDLIDDATGNPTVLETELIDPWMHLEAVPTAADAFALAIVAAI